MGTSSQALSAVATCGVTSIDLRANGLRPAGAAAVCRALTTNTSVRTLDLAENGIDDDGARAVAAMLSANAALSSLDIRQNGLSSVASGVIMATLRSKRVASLFTLAADYTDAASGRLECFGFYARGRGGFQRSNSATF